MPTSRVLGLVIAALSASLILVACGDDDDAGASDEEEAEITEVIEFSAASGDPAACTEAQTQAFTEQTTGARGTDAVQQCEEDAAESAQDVEVSNIEVDGETATADVAITGSFFDGQTLEVGLIKEGPGEGGLLGPESPRWKVDELIGFVDGFDREAFSAAFRESITQEEGVPSGAVECVTENVDALSEQQIEDLFVNSDRELENQVFEPCFSE